MATEDKVKKFIPIMSENNDCFHLNEIDSRDFDFTDCIFFNA